MSAVEDIEREIRGYVRELGTVTAEGAKKLVEDINKVAEKWSAVFEPIEEKIKRSEIEDVRPEWLRDIIIDEFNKTLREIKDETVRSMVDEIVGRFVEIFTEEMGKEAGDDKKMVG